MRSGLLSIVNQGNCFVIATCRIASAVVKNLREWLRISVTLRDSVNSRSAWNSFLSETDFVKLMMMVRNCWKMDTQLGFFGRKSASCSTEVVMESIILIESSSASLSTTDETRFAGL